MKRFIFMERNGIHIIDLQQTLTRVEDAYAFMRDLATSGGQILFVGTKKQAQESIAEESKRATMPFINQRWLGGFLTNFVTIQKRINRLNELHERKERGDFSTMPKKDAQRLQDELEHLDRYFSGVREMKRPPAALFVVDPHREHIAVEEARRLEIPVVAMVDTNCDPDLIDVIIPANDYARAKDLLRERGLEKAAKKSEREAKEGVIASYIHAGGRIGALVEVASETDFVSRGEEFQKLAQEVAMQVAAMAPSSVDELLD